MYNIIKFLLVPITMIGINISNCYSMEIDNDSKIIGKNEGVIRYSSSGLSNEGATWEQWTKRANFDPIDADGEQYDNFHVFCEEHNLVPLRDGIRGFLVDIYNLAHSLIDSDENHSSSITTSTKRWINQRKINNEEIMHLNNQNTYTAFFPLKEMHSIIRNAQKKMNPKKYSNNEINNIKIAPNQEFKLMDGCYYFANQLVQLTHDIVYALNNKVNAYKIKKMSNEEIYRDFKDYLIEEVINPCYRALVQAFLLFIISEGDFALDNIMLTPDYDKTTRNFLDELKDNCNIKNIRYNFIYNISSLKPELSRKNKEFINTLNNSIKEIRQNMKNISNIYINKALKAIENLSTFIPVRIQYHNMSQYTNKKCPVIIKDIDNKQITENNEIIDNANFKLSCIPFIAEGMIEKVHDFFLYSISIKVEDSDEEDDNLKTEILEYNQYKKEMANLCEILDNINMQIPNKDYLSEIKELLKRIG